MDTVATTAARSESAPKECLMSQAEIIDPQTIVEGIVEFATRFVEPLAARHADVLDDPRRVYDDNGLPSSEWVQLRKTVRMESARAGYYTLFAPTELGGGGQGAVTTFLGYEAIHHRFGGGKVLYDDILGKWSRGPSVLVSHMQPQLRERVMPRLFSGEEIFCFGLSEPDAGSDAWALSTRAHRTDGGWVLNGVKQWTSDAPYADYILVFAVTDPDKRDARTGGISAFFVPMRTPGITVTSAIRILGELGGTRAIVTFDDVQVSADCLVGELDAGLNLARLGVGLGRMHNAGRAVGTARWGIEHTAGYLNVRRSFGKLLAEHQALQFTLARAATSVYAAYTMAIDCARRLDAGERMDKQLSMVKQFSCETAFEVIDQCMQLHGGMGLSNEARLVDAWHAQRISRIADGSSEVMLRNVARAVLRGDHDI
jgi:acyl-CoA dehydrogenase